MKTKIFNKKLLVTLLVVLIAVMALIITGCFIWLQRSFQKEDSKK